MRHLLLVVSFVAATSAVAQQPRPPRGFSPAQRLAAEINQYEEELRQRTVALKRDAFIVSQVVAGVGELDDFQKNAALQKCLDRVQKAQQKAHERPQASPQTQQTLRSMREDLEKAQDRVGMTDFAELKKSLMKQTHFIQQELFTGLDGVRRDRQVLTDVQARLGRLGSEMDDSLSEALGSTFEFFKAGGQ